MVVTWLNTQKLSLLSTCYKVHSVLESPTMHFSVTERYMTTGLKEPHFYMESFKKQEPM